MTSETRPACANCDGSGAVEIRAADGTLRVVVCGSDVCRALLLDRSVREVYRRLPLQLQKRSK